ncbi:efflux RND transporter periplasmic adaptor subunit [Vibrio hannami]|uniref:efflux RND transporter periplasmic adaptor subunit n=1 Tax=Vibrio hannami TaxID=2717094 RepID=UPI0024104B71|nr:efflux RND transporter periplasmic adaptor subunit [Vibrio hannami]MDG3085440.1 efflux RND transporter periplasmic adaptor subunit [Vibrio hannami]
MKMSKLILGVVLFSILGVLFLHMAGYFTEKLPEQRIVRLADLSNAQTVTIKESNVPVDRTYTGTVISDQQATLSARLTAKVAEVLFDVGDRVEKGDVIMRLESGDLDARVLQTQEALSSAQARLNAARKEYKRVKELVGRKLLSQSEFDRAESELKTSEADFRQAQAAVTEAQTTSSYSIITAPFDGLITQRPINQGDTATPGMALLSLYNPKTMQLESSISESLISNITLGSKLSYQLPTYDVQGVGEVVEIAPAADHNSRSFTVKVALDSKLGVYPGIFGRIIVEEGTHNIIQLPEDAVFHVGQLDYVKVVDEGIVKHRLVQLGADNRVRKGINAGDVVLLNPLSY